MKITIIGPGALGSLLAANLVRAKNEVWLLDNNGERAKKLSSDGIKLEGLSGSYKAKVNAVTSSTQIGHSDMVIVCVRSYDTEDALKGIKPLLDDNTYILSFQNGLGNLQVIGEFVDTDRIISGVTSHAATLVCDGHIRHTAKGNTVIGQGNRRLSGGLREISLVLSKAGFTTKLSKDINSLVWSELVINTGINALSAITHLKNGMLLKNEYTREIMRRAVSEAGKIAKRKRIKLTYDDPIQKVEAVCRATSENLSFMLQDVLNCRPTEIDFINGAIVRQGKSLNIKTPTNEMLTELVKAIEVNYNSLVLNK
jgi:2-dehydropantoate 2-reductase